MGALLPAGRRRAPPSAYATRRAWSRASSAVAVAATLWQTQDGRRVCAVDGGPTPGPPRRFRIEVGLADGRIAELARRHRVQHA